MMNYPTFLLVLIQVSTLIDKSSSTLFHPRNNLSLIRGGSLSPPKDPNNNSEISNNLNKVQSYKLQQQHLLQLRSTFLSESLSQRGIHIGPTMVDVVTPEGKKPPQVVDWDCCLSTADDPKTCLYSFDAEPNTKVVSPVGTTQYISLSALNRLRRTDPSKVEPMWHSQYAILKSWFSDESEYSLMQFVGFKGFVVSTLLLDLGKGMALKGLLAFSVLAAIIICMPLIEIIMSRFLTSSILWSKWSSWGKFVHAALPLKILIGQMAWNFITGSFAKLEAVVREHIVDLECAILEDCIPVTNGGDINSGVTTDDDETDDDDDVEDVEDVEDEEAEAEATESESDFDDDDDSEYDY